MLRNATVTASVLSLAFASNAIAQAPKATDLLSDEWRVRNATAVKLIKHHDTRNQDLLQILQTQWHGHVPTPGMGGGGRSRASDPRSQTLHSAARELRSAAREIGYDWPVRPPRHPKSLRAIGGAMIGMRKKR